LARKGRFAAAQCTREAAEQTVTCLVCGCLLAITALLSFLLFVLLFHVLLIVLKLVLVRLIVQGCQVEQLLRCAAVAASRPAASAATAVPAAEATQAAACARAHHP